VKNALNREKPFYKENLVIFSKKIRGCKNQNNKEIFGNIGLNEG